MCTYEMFRKIRARKVLWPDLWYYPDMCPEESMKNGKDSPRPGCDSNRTPREWKSQASPFVSALLVSCAFYYPAYPLPNFLQYCPLPTFSSSCPPAVSSVLPWPAQSCIYGDKPFYFHALGAFSSVLNQPVPDPESYKRFLESCLGGADPFIPHPQHWLLWLWPPLTDGFITTKASGLLLQVGTHNSNHFSLIVLPFPSYLRIPERFALVFLQGYNSILSLWRRVTLLQPSQLVAVQPVLSQSHSLRRCRSTHPRCGAVNTSSWLSTVTKLTESPVTWCILVTRKINPSTHGAKPFMERLLRWLQTILLRHTNIHRVFRTLSTRASTCPPRHNLFQKH